MWDSEDYYAAARQAIDVRTREALADEGDRIRRREDGNCDRAGVIVRVTVTRGSEEDR